MSLLEELESERENIEDKLREIIKGIKEEKLRIAKEERGIFIGCIAKDEQGNIYKVTEIDTDPCDGKWSVNVNNLYISWELVDG